MSVELIGVIIVAFAGLGLLHSFFAVFTVLAVAAILQAAAALYIGSAFVQPGHLAVIFFLTAVALRQNALPNLLQVVVFPRLGFFLLILTIWGLFTALTVPRLFAGSFTVYPLTHPVAGTLQEYPIAPNPSNFNQSLYTFVNLFAFIAVAATARNVPLIHRLGLGLLIAAGANLAIAILDVATAAVGLEGLLSFIRNADFAQEFGQRIMGIKRITGSYPEPSMYAAVTVGIFAYALRLWRGGMFAPYSGAIAFGLLMTLLLSTSTTGYVALAVYLFTVYSLALAGIDPAQSSRSDFRSRRMLFVMFGPMTAFMGMLVVAWKPDLLDPIKEMFQFSIVDKLASDSGVERSRWNANAISNFFESYGVGAGLGTSRTSSFLVGIIGKLGVVGIILYSYIFFKIFRPTRSQRAVLAQDWQSQQIAAAARSGCFGFVIGQGVSSATLDLGLLFFIMAGVACGNHFYKRVPFAPRPPSSVQG